MRSFFTLFLAAATTSLATAEVDVAIRVLFNHGIQKDGSCNEQEMREIQNSFALSVENLRSKTGKSCGDYCEDLQNCWIVHECNSVTNKVKVPEDFPLLSEMEMAVPEINDAELAGFSPSMREQCEADRVAIRKTQHTLVTSGILSKKCASFTRKKLNLSCVVVPTITETA